MLRFAIVILSSCAFLHACSPSADKFRLCYEENPNEFIEIRLAQRTFSTADYRGPVVECEDDFEGFCIRRPLLIALPSTVDLYSGSPLEWSASGTAFVLAPLDKSRVLIQVEADWGRETYEMDKDDGFVSRRVVPVVDGKEMPEERWFICQGSFDPIDVSD